MGASGGSARVAGEGCCECHRKGHGQLDRKCTENSLMLLNARAEGRTKAEGKEKNLCLVSAIKIRQQDGQSKEAG